MEDAAMSSEPYEYSYMSNGNVLLKQCNIVDRPFSRLLFILYVVDHSFFDDS